MGGQMAFVHGVHLLHAHGPMVIRVLCPHTEQAWCQVRETSPDSMTTHCKIGVFLSGVKTGGWGRRKRRGDSNRHISPAKTRQVRDKS
jgi:hypothetical protein